MSFSSITPAEIEVGRPITHGLWDKVRRNFDDHQMRLATAGMGTGQVPNGSFEIDANNDGIPDGWTRHLFPGGSGILTTDPITLAHGARSYTFIHPGGIGNGGGILESDFVEVDSLVRKTLHFILWSSVPGIRSTVQISYFNHARVFLSDVLVYDSTANPGIPTYFVRIFVPPAGTRFIRVVLIGGHPSANIAGHITFDAISLNNMPQWNFRSDFTMPEVGTTSTWYVDVASATIHFPFNHNLPINMIFNASVRTGWADLAAFQRFRVGGAFSTEHGTGSVTWTVFMYLLNFSAHGESAVTIFQQLRADGHWAHGIKNIPHNFCNFL